MRQREYYKVSNGMNNNFTCEYPVADTGRRNGRNDKRMNGRNTRYTTNEWPRNEIHTATS